MTDNKVIQVAHVSKSFNLPHERHTSIKSALINFHNRGYERQHVLKDISFEITKGEFFGIVGRNGSGKSTLLKLLAGIYVPDEGDIEINGRLTPFIELGVGFNPELTGRENVFLNGALLGFDRKQMRAMYDEIVEFAELERFMDQKLKNYSSGMQVRLAFSIAIRAESQILLLDEVLAVGDAAFQAKCFDYFQKLQDTNTTVIFISHDKNALERFCSRGILIEKGKIIEAGSINKVLKKYSRIVLSELEKSGQHDVQVTSKAQAKDPQVAEIFSTRTLDGKGKLQNKFNPGEAITVKFSVKVKKDIVNPILGVTIREKNVTKPVFASNTLIEGTTKSGVFVKGSKINFQLALPNNLNDGEYNIEPAIANESASVFFDQKPRAATFYISGGENPYSIIIAKSRIQIGAK